MFRTTTTGFDRVQRLLRELVRASGRPLVSRVGVVLREQTDRRFDSKRDPANRPWREWSPTYAATRPAGASLLIDTGALRKQIELRIAGERAELVVQTPYAGHVQEQRSFLGIGPQDSDELTTMIEAHFLEAIGAA